MAVEGGVQVPKVPVNDVPLVDDNCESAPPAKSHSTFEVLSNWWKKPGSPTTQTPAEPQTARTSTKSSPSSQKSPKKGFLAYIDHKLLGRGEGSSKKAAAGGGTPLGGGSKSGMTAVFAELQKSNSQDNGGLKLKHVTDDMKAKNRPDKTGLVVISNDSTACHSPAPSNQGFLQKLGSKTKMTAGAATVNGRKRVPERFELEADKDWIVEGFYDRKEPLKIEEASLKHNLHIRECDGLTLVVTPKINNVVIESCRNTNVVLSDLISSMEVIHCQRTKVQVTGNCPCANIDSSAGIMLYLSKDGKNVAITSSKSSEMNICFPVEGEDGEEEHIEVPIPEQFVHHISDKDEIISAASDLYR